MAAVLPDGYDAHLARLSYGSPMRGNLGRLLTSWATAVRVVHFDTQYEWEFTFDTPEGERVEYFTEPSQFRVFDVFRCARKIRSDATDDFAGDMLMAQVRVVERALARLKVHEAAQALADTSDQGGHCY